MEQPVINTLLYIVKFTGGWLIAIILFWRFLMPTKVSHLPLGTEIYNKEHKIFIYRAIICLLVAIFIIIFLEKPDLISEKIVGLRLLITNKYIIYILYGIALFFFLGAMAGFFGAIWIIPRMNPLTQEIKDNDYYINPALYKFIEAYSWIIKFGLGVLLLISVFSLFGSSLNLDKFFPISLTISFVYFIQQMIVILGANDNLKSKQLIGLFAYFLGFYIILIIPLFISMAFRIKVSDKYLSNSETTAIIGTILTIGVFVLLVWIFYNVWKNLKAKSKYLQLADDYEKDVRF